MVLQNLQELYMQRIAGLTNNCPSYKNFNQISFTDADTGLDTDVDARVIILPRSELLYRQAESHTAHVHLRNEFYFSEVYRSVNYIGLHAKYMNPK